MKTKIRGRVDDVLRKRTTYCSWDFWSFGLLGLSFWEGGLHNSTLWLQLAITRLQFAGIRTNASASLHESIPLALLLII